MVGIHSIATSSHPCRHEREAEGEATSCSRAGRLRRAGGRSGATTVVVESQPQRIAGIAAGPLTAAGVDATLLAARQLLNNPPPSEVSPSAVEQWCHGVDQLLYAVLIASRKLCHYFQAHKISVVSSYPEGCASQP
jgi:hypothetical protein